jgi:GNAT superfamily N-acetyltransferase
MKDLKKFIATTIREYLNENRLRNINEAYDDVSMDYIKSRKKLSEYNNYDDKIVIRNNTYLNFVEKDDDWFLWGYIYVFDNEDGTEIANASYGKVKEHSNMKASIDVRSDKRRTGIASNIYQWIEKLTGEKLYPDTPHSKSAEALWNNPNRKFGFDK